jgi:hypothetical protein
MVVTDKQTITRRRTELRTPSNPFTELLEANQRDALRAGRAQAEKDEANRALEKPSSRRHWDYPGKKWPTEEEQDEAEEYIEKHCTNEWGKTILREAVEYQFQRDWQRRAIREYWCKERTNLRTGEIEILRLSSQYLNHLLKRWLEKKRREES